MVFQNGFPDLPDSLQKPRLASPMFQEDYVLQWFRGAQKTEIIRCKKLCLPKINQFTSKTYSVFEN